MSSRQVAGPNLSIVLVSSRLLKGSWKRRVAAFAAGSHVIPHARNCLSIQFLYNLQFKLICSSFSLSFFVFLCTALQSSILCVISSGLVGNTTLRSKQIIESSFTPCLLPPDINSQICSMNFNGIFFYSLSSIS